MKADTTHRYEQLAELIFSMIDNGTLAPGTRLPSVREASEQHHVSISTVLQAYRQLENRGGVVARPKSGFYVAASHGGTMALPSTSRPRARARHLLCTGRCLFRGPAVPELSAPECRSRMERKSGGWRPAPWQARKEAARALSTSDHRQFNGRPRGFALKSIGSASEWKVASVRYHRRQEELLGGPLRYEIEATVQISVDHEIDLPGAILVGPGVIARPRPALTAGLQT